MARSRSTQAGQFVFWALSCCFVGVSCNSIYLRGDVAESLSLRRSLVDKNGATKPAFVRYTEPAGEMREYQIDAGLSLDFIADSPLLEGDLLIGTEVHKNTFLEKEQDSSTISFSYEPTLASWGSADQGLGELMARVLVSYKRNLVKSAESAIPTVEFDWLNKSLSIGTYSDDFESARFPYQTNVSFGVHQESILDAAEGDPTGGITRAYVATELAIYFGDLPWKTPKDGKLKDPELDFSYGARLLLEHTYWNEFSKSRDLDTGNDDLELFRATLEIGLTEENQVSLGLTYQNGEDPLNGLEDQEFLALGFNFRF